MTRLPLAALIAFGSLAALAAPVPKDRDSDLPPPTEKQLQASRNNLLQIAIAIHSYHDAHGRMPNSVVDKGGKVALSWRVLILPQLEEADLYEKFKLDEPWDSKTNKPLSEMMPKAFAPIRVKAKRGETFYRGFDGPDTVFEAGKKRMLAQIPDGTSNTLMVVEAGEPCLWSKPDDLPYDAKKPLPKLGGLFDGDFHVLMGDGSVKLGHNDKVDAAEFRKLITCSDGMVVDSNKALGTAKK